MVYGRYDITIVLMGFINQLITGGHHPVHEDDLKWKHVY